MAREFMDTAWDREREEFVRIGVGEAQSLRPLCKSGRLVCPIPTCGAPKITTRKAYTTRLGTFVRDGFRHESVVDQADHSPESLRHQAGKAAIFKWLRDIGFTKVVAERQVRIHGRVQESTAAVRRPDVSAVSPEGRRFAFEIQVSDLDEMTWRHRTTDLRGEGFVVIWLWAWQSDEERTVARTTAMRALINGRSRPWFLDPGVDEWTPDEHERVPRLAQAHQVVSVAGEEYRITPERPEADLHLTWRAVDEYTIRHDDIVVARGDEHLGEDDAYRAATKRVATTQRPSTSSQVRNYPLPAPDDYLAEIDERAASRRSRARGWGDAPVVGSLPKDLETLCGRVDSGDAAIWRPPLEWKAPVVSRLLHRPADTRVSIQEIVTWVENTFPCDSAKLPVGRLIQQLETMGYLTRVGQSVVTARSLQDAGMSDGVT